MKKEVIYKYRKLDFDTDYPILKKFWKDSKMKIAPSPNLLSGHGVVAELNGLLIGALFLYPVYNSQLALIGFPILDPQHKDNRNEILTKLYDYCEFKAKDMGYSTISTWSNLPFVKDRLESMGYVEGDTNQSNYLKIL